MSKEVKEVQVWITAREFQLIEFLRKNFKAGKLELTVHDHEPKKVTIKEPEVWFDGLVKEIQL
jgi:hypothetical protein